MCLAIKSSLLFIVMVSVLCQFVINAICFLTDGPRALYLMLSLLVVIFVDANSLDPDQDRQNVSPDLDPNRLTL